MFHWLQGKNLDSDNMRRNHTQAISEVLAQYLRDTGLEKPLLESKIINAWPEVVGTTAARLTKKVEIKNGVLYAYIQSAALKMELFNCRFQLLQKLNNIVGTAVIRDIRILG